MHLFRHIDNSAFAEQGCAVTIGNFDAIHIGHQKIMQHLVSAGKRLSIPSVVMTFSPDPEEYFRKENAASRLTTVGSRFFAVRDQNVDVMVVLTFNQRMANTSAEEFVTQYLVEGLNAKYILIGDDFKFGKGRKGDFQLLKSMEGKFRFSVERFDTVLEGDVRVSSTRVREFLAQGKLGNVPDLLGRRYSMIGRVIHGDKRGRDWGFPTLNLPIRFKPPMVGIFAVTVFGIEDRKIEGVASLGTRPTVDGKNTLLEVYLFDFDDEIYGQRICVEFIEKIREEIKFDSLDELKHQIALDCESAKTIHRAQLSTT